MTSIADGSVCIQTSSEAVPAPPSWFGEVVLLTTHLRKHGVFTKISEQVRFARRRFGHFEVLDFVAVLFGYALSGERTLEAFYARLRPWASTFMALFARDRLPSRSALSRFLTALTGEPVEALRTCFLADLVARPLGNEPQTGGLWDRAGTQWLVFDVDGTREAARQRVLPQTADRPAAQRRLRPLCAPGYLGRKRGEVVRTRTTVLHAHTHQWLGTFGNPGNGDYRAELRRAVAAIHAYLMRHQVPPAHAVVRLDGQYGTGAVLATGQELEQRVDLSPTVGSENVSFLGLTDMDGDQQDEIFIHVRECSSGCGFVYAYEVRQHALQPMSFQGGSGLSIGGGGVGAGFTCRIEDSRYQVLQIFTAGSPEEGGPAMELLYEARNGTMQLISEREVTYTPEQALAAVGAHCPGLSNG